MIKIWAAIGSLITAAIWGFAFVVVKDSLNSLSAAYMLAFRFTVGALFLSLVFFKRLKKINRSYLKNGGMIGIFLFMGYLTQTIGCNYTTPGKNAFFTTIYVILVPLISWPVYRKRPAWYVFVAAFLQLIGIGFLSLTEDVRSGIHLSVGDVLTLICGIFYALQIFAQSNATKDPENNDPLIYAVLQIMVAAILSWIIAPFYSSETGLFTTHIQALPVHAILDKRVLLSVLYLGIGSTGIAFLLQNIGLKYLNEALATILLSFESVFGMLFSVLIPVNGVRETLTMWGVFGCALIFSAVLLAQKTEKSSELK